MRKQVDATSLALTRVIYQMQVVFAGLDEDPIYHLLQPEMVGFSFCAVPIPELARVREADVLVVVRGRWGHAELSGLPISLLQRFGAGYETVDLQTADQLGIWVANVPSLPSGNADAVADLTVFLLLGVARRANQLIRAIRDCSWEFPIGTSLTGKTACLIGMGGLGLAVAVRLQAMGMRLIGVRKHPTKIVPEELNFDSVYGPESIREALSRCYCAILTASSGPETHHLIGDDELAAMPQGGVLINVGRGALVDESALLRNLDSGHLQGAGLDVFAEEPTRAGNPLANHPRVFATPHCGGSTQEALNGIAAHVGNNLRNYAAGKRLGSILNHPPSPRFKLH